MRCGYFAWYDLDECGQCNSTIPDLVEQNHILQLELKSLKMQYQRTVTMLHLLCIGIVVLIILCFTRVA